MFELLIILLLPIVVAALIKPLKINVIHKNEEYTIKNGQWILCDGKICGEGKSMGNGIYVCKHYNLRVKFPKIAIEWHSKNSSSPENYTPFSSKEVWWKCKDDPCGCHQWLSTINNRTKNKSGCPYCAPNGKSCIHNNLKIMFSEIASEWDSSNTSKPEDYRSGSNEYVWWKCKNDPCGCHRWLSMIINRTRNGSGCPYCAPFSECVCLHNNFKVEFPKLVIEWSTKNNKKPEEYRSHSGQYIIWNCKINPIHEWKTTINTRVKYNTGCPHCFAIRSGSGYSKSSIEWMKSTELNDGIKIQYIDPDKGIPEYYINCVGKVDGYCKETNTVYEFHGDYWHGNPNMFSSEDINRVNGKTFGQLYKNTTERDNKIRSLGYNLIVKWETDLELIDRN